MRIASDLTDMLDSSKNVDLQARYDALVRQNKDLMIKYESLLSKMEGIEAFNVWASKNRPSCIIITDGKLVLQNKLFVELIRKSKKGKGYWRISGGKKAGLLKHQIISTARALEMSPDMFPFTREYFLDPTFDGSLNAVEALFEPYVYCKKRYISVILQDITTRTPEKKRLDGLSLYFNSIINPLLEDVFIIDKDYRINYVSNSFLEKAGMAREEIVGRYCYEVAALKPKKCYKDDLQCPVQEVYKKGDPVRVVRQSIRENGLLQCIDVIAVPIHDKKGNIIQVMETLRDITEFMATHNALLISEKRYQTLVEQLPVIVYTAALDEANSITFISPQVKSFIGISASEIIATPNLRMEIIHPADRHRVVKEFSHCRKTRKTSEGEYRIVKPDGQVSWVHDRAVLISDEKGEPQYFLGVMADISDRKKTEDTVRLLSSRLLNAQEEEKSRIARDLHDGLGQSLAVINYSLEDLSKSLPNNKQREKQKIKEVIDSIYQVSTDLRGITFNLRPSMLDHLGLVSTLEWISKDISKKHNLQVDFQAMGMKRKLPPHLENNLFRLFQEAINNIIKHAKTQKVNLKLIHRHPKIIAIISDDGQGFDPNSTLRDNNWMGIIGMKQRVSTLGGQFNIRSGVGRGTTVRIEIPLNQEEGP